MTGTQRTLEDLRGKALGVPVALPPFDPDRDVPDAPDYADPESWLTLPAHFGTEKQPVDVFWVYPTILSDGSPHDELSSFAPTAASAAVLSRFFGVADKQTESFELMAEGIKLYNDYTYRKQVDELDAKIASLPEGEEKEALVKKRDALAKNILTDLLKK